MIENKTLHLRTVKEEDLSTLFSALDSLRLKGEHLPGVLLSEHQFRLEFYETGFWAEEKGTLLILKEERIVGALWFEKQAFFDCLDLHFYIFHPEDRRKGLMKEALPLFASYLFATKKIERLQLSIPNYSQAAIRTAQKCGFKFEGIARSALFSRGAYVDLCIYSLLRSEAKPFENIHI
jgi:ribosomal-protein-alanine N-acetyltransferase